MLEGEITEVDSFACELRFAKSHCSWKSLLPTDLMAKWDLQLHCYLGHSSHRF